VKGNSSKLDFYLFSTAFIHPQVKEMAALATAISNFYIRAVATPKKATPSIKAAEIIIAV